MWAAHVSYAHYIMLPYCVLLRIDERGHGQISFTDFEKLFGDEGVKAFFESLQIGAVDAWTLFTTLEACPKVCEQKAAQICPISLAIFWYIRQEYFQGVP